MRSWRPLTASNWREYESCRDSGDRISEDVALHSLRNSFACSSSTLERFLRKVEKAYSRVVSFGNWREQETFAYPQGGYALFKTIKKCIDSNLIR